jgi:LCP family protein required for cell wall assembly
MGYGGFQKLAATLETNFGVRPNYYILTNFNNFTAIIDNLGGVDVNASITLTDRCKFPELKPDGITCVVKPGITHMNGAMALWYVRSRKTTSDFDRERRSQEVLQAIFKKLFSLNALTRIPELFDFYKKNVETNLNLGDVVALAPVAAMVAGDASKIRRYSIGPQQVSDFTVPETGAMVLMPNYPAIQNLIEKAVFTP